MGGDYYIAIFSPIFQGGKIYYRAIFPPIQVRGENDYIAIFPRGGMAMGKNGSITPAEKKPRIDQVFVKVTPVVTERNVK